VQVSGFRLQCSGCRVQGSGLRVQGSGFGVQGSGFRGGALGWGLTGGLRHTLDAVLPPVTGHDPVNDTRKVPEGNGHGGRAGRGEEIPVDSQSRA